ncbi:hypothetical protein M407DRAFT_208950 [Tulasnella calospora MUT 4182]|uniref:SLC41A/MgtE integral membrane domain-containing protein n=1 Tax=Tulasnella calospora MUT 4182 TaxID=1051891 RepID=A0A0C3KVQ3_9AGAM|nr:hypothetical protein M407DRAFT_208950 [Tulasnella calospora MUT 4182]
MVFTGELLERVSRWTALRTTDELFVLIPIINNLKGNLELNLSARLGTAANMGLLNSRESRQPLILGNLLLLQVQALLVSCAAAALSFVLGLVLPSREKMPMEMPQDSPPGQTGSQSNATASVALSLRGIVRDMAMTALPSPMPRDSGPTLPVSRTWGSRFREFWTVLTTAMASASMSGLILGSFMCSLVLMCQRFRLNPDNIAPPIASCLGDLLTLTLLALSSTALLYIPSPVPFLLLLALLGLTFLAVRAASKNAEVKHLLGSGWTPLFGAMLISSGTGMVLEKFVKKYEGFGLMAVIISGLPGSVGAVSISRLSTLLHASEDLPMRTPHSEFIKSPPKGYRGSLTGATLFVVSVPVMLTFLAFVYATGWMDLPFLFVGAFIGFFCLSTTIALVIAHYLTLIFWSRGYDPDNYCLPVHSALCDLIGQLMLVACYELAGELGADVDL